MNCLMCRLALLDALAEAVYSMEETAFGLNEDEFNPEDVVVNGNSFRKVDARMAELMYFEDFKTMRNDENENN